VGEGSRERGVIQWMIKVDRGSTGCATACSLGVAKGSVPRGFPKGSRERGVIQRIV